jgi:hypothetical protein
MNNERINTHDCVDCALKHLSAAVVEMGELQRGYWNTDHEIYCEGNLNEACEQIAGYAPEIAEKLRVLRANIFSEREGVKTGHIKICKGIYWEIKRIKYPDATPLPAMSIAQSALKSPSLPDKPCNCGKKK